MATRKVKRLAGGFDKGEFEGVDEAVYKNTDSGEWARGENYGDNTTGDERVAMAKAPTREASASEVIAASRAKAPIVTKEELAKSGLSLRDYMNKQQGLTRRGEKTSDAKPAVSSRSTASTAKGEDQYDANVKQGPKKGQYMSLQDRQREYEKARAASGTGMYGTRKSEPAEAKKTPGRGVIDTKNINPKTLLPSKGMKEGGGVKGWGSARGARKAKIY